MTTRSSRNATKFGIFATILLSGKAMGEREEDFFVLLSGLRKTFRPVNCFEKVLVEKLAFLLLRLSRVYKADIAVAAIIFKKVKEALEDDEPRIETEHVGEGERLVVSPRGPSPELLIKYEANIERQIARTLDQLERVASGRSTPETAGGIGDADED